MTVVSLTTCFRQTAAVGKVWKVDTLSSAVPSTIDNCYCSTTIHKSHISTCIVQLRPYCVLNSEAFMNCEVCIPLILKVSKHVMD